MLATLGLLRDGRGLATAAQLLPTVGERRRSFLLPCDDVVNIHFSGGLKEAHRRQGPSADDRIHPRRAT